MVTLSALVIGYFLGEAHGYGRGVWDEASRTTTLFKNPKGTGVRTLGAQDVRRGGVDVRS